MSVRVCVCERVHVRKCVFKGVRDTHRGGMKGRGKYIGNAERERHPVKKEDGQEVERWSYKYEYCCFII